MRAALLLIAFSTVACAGTWERHPTLERRTSLALMATSDAAIACDMSQTLWMADGGKWDHGLHEGNPLLGTHPSPTIIVGASVAALAVNTAAYFVLPARWRPYWFGGVTLVEGANVLHVPSNPDTQTFGEHHGCDFVQNARGGSATDIAASALNINH